uniref:Uncharacterized protein n=1 Tax=Rhizophora mucronata TaxID=61149 RepID=A0A2P2P2S5_RHIMU
MTRHTESFHPSSPSRPKKKAHQKNMGEEY